MKIWEAGKFPPNVPSPYEIDKITGIGYKCSECKNSKNFDGEFHLYRLYYKFGCCLRKRSEKYKKADKIRGNK